MGSDSAVSSRLGVAPTCCPLGCAYHMDPLLLAIQVLELVGADVDQGAQVTVISTGEKRWWAESQVACVLGLALTTVYPSQETSREDRPFCHSP